MRWDYPSSDSEKGKKRKFYSLFKTLNPFRTCCCLNKEFHHVSTNGQGCDVKWSEVNNMILSGISSRCLYDSDKKLFIVLNSISFSSCPLEKRFFFPCTESDEDKEPNWQIMLHFVLHHSVVNKWLPLKWALTHTKNWIFFHRVPTETRGVVINLHDPVIFLSL